MCFGYAEHTFSSIHLGRATVSPDRLDSNVHGHSDLLRGDADHAARSADRRPGAAEHLGAAFRGNGGAVDSHPDARRPKTAQEGIHPRPSFMRGRRAIWRGRVDHDRLAAFRLLPTGRRRRNAAPLPAPRFLHRQSGVIH